MGGRDGLSHGGAWANVGGIGERDDKRGRKKWARCVDHMDLGTVPSEFQPALASHLGVSCPGTRWGRRLHMQPGRVWG